MESQQDVPTDKAVKYDKGKLPYHLVPWDAMDEIVAVLRFGAMKYGERNWEQGGHWHRDFAACLRHLTKWFMGEDVDPESGLSHLAHAGCCILFMLAYVLRKIGIDNRPSCKGESAEPYCCRGVAMGTLAHSPSCEHYPGKEKEIAA